MRRLLFAMLVVVLFVTGCGGSSKEAESASQRVEISLKDFMISPTDLTVPTGKVTFLLKNDGEAPHNFGIRKSGDKIAESKAVDPGSTEELVVDLEKGNYDTYCGLPGHESLGMVAKLIVT